MRKAVNHLKKSCPVMAAIIDRCGPPRMDSLEPDFRTLARCIVGQQLSRKAARTIFARVEHACGRAGVTPKAILGLGPENLRPLGLSTQKTGYLLDLAEKTKGRQLRFDRLHGMSDEEVIGHLTQVKGIGVWTAQMLLMFALKREDVFPAGDLGIRNAIQRGWGLAEPPKAAAMEEIAKPWSPYRTLACWYLWRSLENEAGL
jgi:DNA-3-methyladenine glycosylase II